jgi:hypothetical protein
MASKEHRELWRQAYVTARKQWLRNKKPKTTAKVLAPLMHAGLSLVLIFGAMGAYVQPDVQTPKQKSTTDEWDSEVDNMEWMLVTEIGDNTPAPSETEVIKFNAGAQDEALKKAQGIIEETYLKNGLTVEEALLSSNPALLPTDEWQRLFNLDEAEKDRMRADAAERAEYERLKKKFNQK